MLSARDKSLDQFDGLSVWQSFNKNTASSLSGYYEIFMNGQKVNARSYAKLFLKGLKLGKYFNSDCKNIIQFGATAGKFLEIYKKKGWDAVGYEYNSIGINEMQKKQISTRLVDLNGIDPITRQLSYAGDLKADLSVTSNIVLVRVLQFLNDKAVELLLFALMNDAQPGSVFYIAGKVNPDKKEEGMRSDLIFFKKNFLPSFFGPRTDMRFEHVSVSPVMQEEERSYEEVLVVRKI